MKNTTRNFLIAGATSVLLLIGSTASALSAAGLNPNQQGNKTPVNSNAGVKNSAVQPSSAAKATSQGHTGYSN